MTRNSRLQPDTDYGRRVEEEIAAGPPERVALAATLMWGFDVEDDEIMVRFRSCVASLSEHGWANGMHDGDCTRSPHTCFRCVIESDWDRAGRIIESAGQCYGTKSIGLGGS